ncbi:MAG: T9SS type A sorting domain-containing protein [Lentimicrobium sp.]|nr:T9SS type A sorting domain-containing protein [Lentimicrobium sp.]
MNKYNFLILNLLLLFFLPAVVAQNTFLKKYPSSENKSIYSIIETNDNHFIFCGAITPFPDSNEGIGTLSKITSEGDLILTKNYNMREGNSNYVELLKSSAKSGNYFLLGSKDYMDGSQTHNSVFVNTIDNDLNFVTIRDYGFWADTLNSAWDMEILGDSIAFILSTFETQNSTLWRNYSLIKADLLSDNFSYFVPDDSIVKAAASIMIDSINAKVKVNYMIFYLTGKPWNPVANFSYDFTNYEVVMPDNEFYSQTKIGKKDDTTYLISGAFNNYNSLRNLGVAQYNLQDSLLIQVMFPAGIDSVSFPGAGKKNMLVTNDYIWVMNWFNLVQFGFPCQTEQTYIVLNKLNHNLELLDQIYYGGDGVYFPTEIIETSDHCVVVTGHFFNNNAVPYNCHFDPFVLKANHEGLIVNSQSHDLPLAQEAIVFPNPGHDYLQVKLAVQHKTVTLELFDFNGRSVSFVEITADMQQVNTSNLSAGIYPYRITANNRVIGGGKWVKE